LFDKWDKYVTVQSSEQVIIYSLMPHNLGEIVQNYKIDREQYSAILDINIDSGIDVSEYKRKMSNHKKDSPDSSQDSDNADPGYIC
jgi:hypothetical protein